MGKYNSAIILVIFYISSAQAQMNFGDTQSFSEASQIDTTSFIYSSADTGAVVQYYRDARIDKIIDIQKDINKRKNGIPGFRIQLYRGNSQKLSKERAFEIETMVYKKFGKDADVDVIFKTPYWRVQVGNFRLQNEAMQQEKIYKAAFPEISDDISVIPSIIDFPLLGRQIKEQE